MRQQVPLPHVLATLLKLNRVVRAPPAMFGLQTEVGLWSQHLCRAELSFCLTNPRLIDHSDNQRNDGSV
jgi:hypothetical protein